MVKQAIEIYNNQRRHCSLGMKTPEFAHVNQFHKYKSYKKNKIPILVAQECWQVWKKIPQKIFSKLINITSTINYF